MKELKTISILSFWIFKTSIKFLFICIFVTQFIYCKKNKETASVEEPVTAPVTTTPVSRTYWQIDSTDAAIKINLVAYPVFTQTFDFDADNAVDLKFNVDNFASNHLTVLSCSIETANSECYLLCDSVYRIISYYDCDTITYFSNKNELFPKALSYMDTLKANMTWRKGNFPITYYYLAYALPPDPGNCGSHEKALNWPENVWHYIGIKFKGKVGWIKFYSDRSITKYVSEFALVK